MMLAALAYAEGAATAAPRAAGQPGAWYLNLVPLGFMLAIFYFFIIRPQQRKSKEHQNMLGNLKKGDQVLTQGGLYGTVQGFKGGALELKIADNVKVLVAKSSVTSKVNAPSETLTAEVVGQ